MAAAKANVFQKVRGRRPRRAHRLLSRNEKRKMKRIDPQTEMVVMVVMFLKNCCASSLNLE